MEHKNKKWNTWKNVKKLSNFFFCVPRSKHIPHVSRSTQTSLTRKKSSGISRTQGWRGRGRPSATVMFSQVRELIVEQKKRTMTKSNKRPERVKHDPRTYQAVDIELAQVLDGRNPALICTIHILLQASPHVFQYLINNGDSEIGMVTL